MAMFVELVVQYYEIHCQNYSGRAYNILCFVPVLPVCVCVCV